MSAVGDNVSALLDVPSDWDFNHEMVAIHKPTGLQIFIALGPMFLSPHNRWNTKFGFFEKFPLYRKIRRAAHANLANSIVKPSPAPTGDKEKS